MKRFLLLPALSAGLLAMWVQAATVKVESDRPEALYQTGETAHFRVNVTEEDQPLTSGEVQLILTKDGAAEITRAKIPVENGVTEFDYTATEPGFVWCAAEFWQDGDNVAQGLTGVGFSPEQIRQGHPEPADFDAYWAAGKAEAAKIPLDVQLTPAPDLSTPTLELYRISFANVENTRLYGFLSVPKNAEGPFPAVVVIPGAAPAVNAPGGHMIEGVITLFLNVHSYEPLPTRQSYPYADVTLPVADAAARAEICASLAKLPGVRQAYVLNDTTVVAEPSDPDGDLELWVAEIGKKLGKAGTVGLVRLPFGEAQERRVVAEYGSGAYPLTGARDRERNFFRRAWLGMDRATEWLRQYPDFDGKNLGVCGWSQGGGSTLALAGLNPNFVFAVSNQPALCDHGASVQGRTPGWPFFAANFPGDEKVMDEVAYVDAANLARRIKCPIIVLVGFTDGACHPGSVYAAFNNIPAADKTIVNEPNTGHTWNDAYSQSIQKMVSALHGN